MKPTKAQRLVKYPIYTMGDLSSGLYSVTPSILLMFYMTNVLGVSVMLATFAASLPKIIDLISSPLVGGLSDRTKGRFGRRRPYILLGGLSMLPVFGGMWVAPFADPTMVAYFIVAISSICAICYACFLVPYSALNSEISTDYHDGISLNSYRAAYSMVGALLAGAVAPLIVEHFGGGRHGYMVMGLTMGAIMAASIMTTFFSSKEPVRHVEAPTLSVKEMLQALTSNRPFLVLLSTYFLHVVGSGVFSAALAYYVTYVMHRDAEALSQIFFLMFASSVVAIPFFNWLGRKIGKFGSFTVALAIAAITVLGWFWMGSSVSLLLALSLGVIMGASEGGVQVYVFSMLLDTIRHGNSRTDGATPEAVFSGVFMAGEKLAYAAGAVVAGAVFSFAGLVETTTGYVEQPHSAIIGIKLAASLIPSALNVLCCIVFSLYRPFDKRIAEESDTVIEVEQAAVL